MDTSSVVLGLRVLLSLAVVLGLLWWIARRTAGSRARTRQASVTVVGRQSLGRRSGVAVVEVEGRRLLLGVTEQGVSLLTELAAPDPEPTADRTEIDPAELADLVGLDTDALADVAVAAPARAAATRPTPVRSTAARPTTVRSTPTPPSTPAARTPAVPTPRSPLEGSILDVATWRQAVVAVQERTIRR
ncbi:flagellar biosynthetic protein FliO [Actinotalea sp. M2MS4P-6]|uniref:flagellar biosynthetic protein FliO n=1 Tax=Actinotalea sp. M2MS4P-6 TaxID=2983762 RepID=UPI0021E48CB1|nr:flagellar biosynthetic protein FliO [Actinotalea sp. M2MS4P-6]MCV2392775.1 flagellar biosynthetic protein FliO [Actinotalea sp. M2MS4P-6]